MVIYGEYLFLENFVTGIMILFFTGKILGARLRPIPILFCAVCCGAYAFVLFLPFSGLSSWICKGAFSLLMVWVAYHPEHSKKLFYGAAVFLGVTIFYGGIAIAFLTSFSRTGVTAAAGLYLSPLTYCMVTIAAVVAALFLWFLLNILKTKRMECRRIVDVEIQIAGILWKTKGFIDSGNDLREPLTGRPVCVIPRRFAAQLRKKTETPDSRYTVIPYHTVGVDHGLLEGFRTDYIRLSKDIVVKHAVLAICDEKQFQTMEEGVEILLSSSMLERGIYGDIEAHPSLVAKKTDEEREGTLLHRRQ